MINATRDRKRIPVLRFTLYSPAAARARLPAVSDLLEELRVNEYPALASTGQRTCTRGDDGLVGTTQLIEKFASPARWLAP